ncbi:hypothetical protein AB0P17_08500 [Streptomyces sp. NPDC088124]|uniref:hypothetical protein n=1 Tax=Streptomyces sp. NPDC088124 TaxID=3154654 RepID=UPI0034273897
MTSGQRSGARTAAVRHRLALGRLLALGDAADGAWLAEGAATAELRRAAAGVAGTALDAVRIALADPEAAGPPAVVPPPGAQPPGPLRIDAEFAAGPGEPLPALAERLRGALFRCAVDGLGLRVTDVDLRVTALLDSAPRPPAPAGPAGRDAAEPEGATGRSVAAVPGVAYLTRTLGRAVYETAAPDGGVARVRVELATAAGHRPLDVARAVRARLAGSPGAPSVTVVVSAVEAPAEHTTPRAGSTGRTGSTGRS